MDEPFGLSAQSTVLETGVTGAARFRVLSRITVTISISGTESVEALESGAASV